jgi:hypothetical protein
LDAKSDPKESLTHSHRKTNHQQSSWGKHNDPKIKVRNQIGLFIPALPVNPPSQLREEGKSEAGRDIRGFADLKTLAIRGLVVCFKMVKLLFFF